MTMGLVIAIAAAAIASVAFGFWSSTGASTASASTQSFTAPGTPSATASGGGSTVDVSWTAAQLSDGTTQATGYYVTRTNTATSATSNACGSSPAARLGASAVSCSDTGAPAGTYSYAITAVYHSWTARSASTGQVTVSSSSISLSPSTGTVGSTTTVSGSGFPGSSSVTITYDGTTVATTSTAAGGGFSGASFTVPASAAGSHAVVATASGASSSATFTVTPRATLSPASAVAGTTATITGTGFAAGKSVSATFAGTALTLSGGTTNGSGGFSATYTVPNQAPGSASVVATDASGNSDSATFTIPTPSIALATATGNVGDQVSVSGSNFPAGASLSATFDGTPVTVAGTTSTSSSGSFTGATFSVPAAAAGSRSVQFTAATRSAAASYTVTPKITLSPTSGFAGDTGTIVGTGFATGSSITATFGGASLTLGGTTTTNTNGSFSGATYTVPNQPFGSKTVSVTDAASHNATAPFTLHQASFVIDSPPATVTAGSPFSLTLRAILDGSTDTTYAGTHGLTITGASNSPNGSTPTKPTSASFTGGSSALPITLVKAGTESLSITDGLRIASGSIAVNSAGVTLSYNRTCPVVIPKNSSANAFTLNVPNDAFGNAFTRVGGISVGLSLSNPSNFTLSASSLQISSGPTGNSFTLDESGANKTTTLTASVPAPFTAPPVCTISSSN